VRGINLSRIESRPNKQAMGHYIFFLDFEGHRQDAKGAEAIASLLEKVHGLHLLGSYPRGN
jgi:prephenate dehydratase